MTTQTDWFGLWYKILKERGENDCPTLGKLNLLTNEVEWVKFSHSEMDGVGALKKYYDQKNFILTNLPELREKKAPTFLEAILILKKMLFKEKSAKTNWKYFNPKNSPTDPLKIHWKIFTQEETRKLDSYCKNQTISKNAFLLNFTSKVLLRELSHNAEGTWTIPVNLRPVLKRDNFYSNHSSGVLIPIKQNDSVQSTQNKLKMALKNKEHWAIWWAHQIGRIVGVKGMRFISKRSSNKNFLAGSFSNLGNWDLAPHEIWVGSPPGSKNFPISIMVMQANEQLSFSLKIHNSVLSHENFTKNLLDMWSTQLLELLQ